MLFRPLRKLLITCMLLLLWAAAQAAPSPAGTVISNTASATFVDTATGLPVRINSNTVNTTVAALEALTLNASQNLLIGVGSSFTISHNLGNTGTTPPAGTTGSPASTRPLPLTSSTTCRFSGVNALPPATLAVIR